MKLANINVILITMRMNKTILLLLLFVCQLQAIRAQVTGVTPETGKTYYIYNVYSKSYIAFDGDGKLSLGAQGTAVTLSSTSTDSGSSSSDNSESTYFMTAANGNKVATTFLGDVTADGKGTYDHWLFSQVNGTSADQHIYAIGTRIPDASAVAYLYRSDLLNKVIKLFIQPASNFTKGQWLLVSQEDYEKENVITLDEASTSYTQPTVPTSGSVAVHLKRSFSIGMWNSLCLPFAVDAAQVKSVLGDEAQVAEFTGCTENTLLFTSVDAIEAGKPYLINPKKEATNGYYEFTGITSFAKEPTHVSQTPTGNATQVDYIGYFYKTTAPKAAYVLRKNEVYHLQSEMPMKGFRAYFQEQGGSAESKVNYWSLDGISTGINEIAGEAQAQKMDVYNLNGQRVASQVTTLDGIAPGIYLVKGKKVIIK